jgi:Arc/MetJ family transcription regulator
MRTNIDIDESLMAEAINLSNAKSKKDLIHLALREYIASRKRMNLADLKGKISFASDYDYKALRNEDAHDIG